MQITYALRVDEEDCWTDKQKEGQAGLQGQMAQMWARAKEGKPDTAKYANKDKR